MPTFRHGKNTAVLFDAYDLSAFFRSANIGQQVDTAETSAFGSTAKTYVPGLENGTMGVEGMFSGASVADVDPVLSAVLGVATDDNVTVMPEGNVQGRRAFFMQSLTTNYAITSPVGDMVSVTADFQGDGGVDSGYIVQNSAAISTTSNSTSVDFGASSTTSNGGCAILHVITNTRDAGSITVVVKDSADNVTFAALGSPISFTAVNAGSANITSQRIVTTSSVRRYVRAEYTVTAGSSGAYTLAVVFAKR